LRPPTGSFKSQPYAVSKFLEKRDAHKIAFTVLVYLLQITNNSVQFFYVTLSWCHKSPWQFLLLLVHHEHDAWSKTMRQWISENSFLQKFRPSKHNDY